MLKFIQNIRDQIKELEEEISDIPVVHNHNSQVSVRKKMIESLTKSLENVHEVAKEELITNGYIVTS